ncbi:thioesterase II family protein [Streptomyces sp. NPDC002537]
MPWAERPRRTPTNGKDTMTDWDRRTGPWITRYTPAAAEGGPVQLVCLPHAGGSATFFRPLARVLPPGIEVLAVQYPGRQERRSEPLVDDLSRLADGIAEALEHAGDAPLALFGHSMGALVAWEVARRLTARTGRQPVGLVVSGRPAPAVGTGGHRLRDRTDAEIVADMRHLTGTDAGLLDDPGMLEMVLPVLRADYRAIDGHRYRPGPPLRCPVGVFSGDDDPWARGSDMGGWCDETTGPVMFRSFPGNHFYLSAQWHRVADAVTATLARVTAAG